MIDRHSCSRAAINAAFFMGISCLLLALSTPGADALDPINTSALNNCATVLGFVGLHLVHESAQVLDLDVQRGCKLNTGRALFGRQFDINPPSPGKICFLHVSRFAVVQDALKRGYIDLQFTLIWTQEQTAPDSQVRKVCDYTVAEPEIQPNLSTYCRLKNLRWFQAPALGG